MRHIKYTYDPRRTAAHAWTVERRRLKCKRLPKRWYVKLKLLTIARQCELELIKAGLIINRM
jgi:hypothetical protein